MLIVSTKLAVAKKDQNTISNATNNSANAGVLQQITSKSVAITLSQFMIIIEIKLIICKGAILPMQKFIIPTISISI